MPGVSRKAVLAATRRSNGDSPKIPRLSATTMRGSRPDGSGSNSPARPKTKPPSR